MCLRLFKGIDKSYGSHDGPLGPALWAYGGWAHAVGLATVHDPTVVARAPWARWESPDETKKPK